MKLVKNQYKACIVYQITICSSCLSVCTDDMGLDAGLLDPRQVTVSSSKQPHFRGRQASLSAPVGWLPLLNSPSEWIQVSINYTKNQLGRNFLFQLYTLFELETSQKISLLRFLQVFPSLISERGHLLNFSGCEFKSSIRFSRL